MTPRNTSRIAQAWIELRSDDPEAVSALEIARRRVAGGRRLRSLRRIRLFELTGSLPSQAKLADLLHRSTQFYNPHKELCTVRMRGGALPATDATTWVALVTERDGGRRAAAERWWRHETGENIEVREAVAWVQTFDGPVDEAAAEELTVLRDRRHGLLCNPHAQQWSLSGADVPLPWIRVEPRGDGTRGPAREGLRRFT
jgi:hypothetical protein